ncbi:MAG TPA: hypothetical protein VFZ49_04990 [Pyrinomonadaceae bacterium]
MSGALCSGTSGGSTSTDDGYVAPGGWQVAVGYRWLKSDRAFIGTEEQLERRRLGIINVNRIHLFDVGVTYGVTRRFSISASVPFMYATRTRPGKVDQLAGFPNAPDQVYRSVGFGDVAISGRAWMIRPPAEKRQNVSIGFGVKLPTGTKDGSTVVDTPTGPRRIFNDFSIQLGDGGFGFSVDALAFKSFKHFTLSASGTYLFNPRNTNGVPTGRPRPSEAVMSVSDQYLARAAVSVPVRKIRGFALNFGGRLEGVPSSDVFGKSDGFRRPGYALSIEPGFSYSRTRETWTLNVPVPVLRNRIRSVPDPGQCP